MDDEKEEKKLEGNVDEEDEENQDTVEQILKCIIENEANMEAFNEMFGNHVQHDPRLRKESVGGIPPHHHTVHSGSDHNSCHLCAQVRSKKGRRQSRPTRFKQRPGEQTVFSVGRFRVTHTDKKLHGGPNPLVSSGDQLDQSKDSEEQKEGGYNLRSMFKDVQSPSEGSTVNVGKRRKSVTIFGLRRGSDPVGMKVREGTGRETGCIRFAIQQQPVVLEELLPAENIEVNGSDTKPGIKPETKPSAPGSLLIPSPALSEHSLKTTEKQRDVVEDKVLKMEEAYDPGPFQTSTSIAPIPGSTPLIPIGQLEPCSSPGFSVTETPCDPSFSPDLESSFGASLDLISLPIKTPSSSSSLKMLISTVGVTPSPKLSSRNTQSEAGKTAFSSSPKLPSGTVMSSQTPVLSSSFEKSASPLQAPIHLPALTASSKLDTMPVSPQTPSSSPADQNLSFISSPRLTLKSGSVMSVASMNRGDTVYLNEQELEGARTLKTKEETEISRVGLLKTVILSPVEGPSKGSALYSPTEKRLSSLPLSPSSPLSLSSPIGSRINSVTIIKASPDSKREFSVTMMEQEISLTSINEQRGATSELGVESEKAGINPAIGQGDEIYVSGVGHCESQCEETPRAEVKPRVSQEKDDMVEMEDIRDCKVIQVEEVEKVEEELEKMLTI
ncbi:RELT-like protein 2 isoform X2 [Pseudoliparis swirei]|nr:RELT-like protein 2 isoform X2 [Pseudoliparis swirei]